MHNSLPHSSFDVRSAWRVVSRQQWVVAGSILAFAGLALLLNATTLPVYRTSARIEIKQVPSRSPLTGETIESQTQLSENLALFTTAELVTNRVLIEQLAQSLAASGVALAPAPSALPLPIRVQKWLARLPFAAPREVASASDRTQHDVDWLLKTISVRPVRDTRLVDIQAEHAEPGAAAEIANRTAQKFVEFEAARRDDANRTRLAYLDSQIASLRAVIQSSEHMLYGTREANPALLQGRSKQLSQAIGEASGSYIQAHTDRLTVEAQLERARAFRLDSTLSVASLPVQTPALDELHRQLLMAETELAKTKHFYRDQSAELVTAESQVVALREGLRRELDKAISDLAAQRETLLAREATLRQTMGENETGLRSTTDRAYQNSTLESELATNRTLYDLLLRKAQEQRIAQTIEPELVELVVPARQPLRQARPRKALNLLLGVVVGFVFGVGLAFALESLRRTIRTPNDVVHKLHLPVMGMIPKRL